jgi:hypothetical protein
MNIKSFFMQHGKAAVSQKTFFATCALFVYTLVEIKSLKQSEYFICNKNYVSERAVQIAIKLFGKKKPDCKRH